MTNTPAPLTAAALADLAALRMHYDATGGESGTLFVVKDEYKRALLNAAPSLIAAAQELARLRQPLADADLAALAAEYAPTEVPPCPVCGAEPMRVSQWTDSTGAVEEEWVCSSLEGQVAPFNPEIRSHYDNSSLFLDHSFNPGDPRVVALVVELAQARARIAGLEKRIERQNLELASRIAARNGYDGPIVGPWEPT